MFQKFATAEITGVKSSPDQLGRTASLEHFSDYSDYRTDDGYIYVRVRAISSRVNKNHDGWPSTELAKSYRTFLGKPNFVDHHNHDPERMRGVVVDAQLHVDDDKTSALDPYYATAPKEHTPPTWIELLIETDAKSFPKLAKAIADGHIDSVSMGCNVEKSKCSHCGNWATNPDEYCQHIQNKGADYDYYRDGQKTSKKSYEDCYDIGFFEISYVFDPADETALFLEKPRMSKVANDPQQGIQPHPALQYYSPDQVAETVDGISMPTSGALWSLMNSPDYRGAPIGGDRHDPYGEHGEPMVEDPTSARDVMMGNGGDLASHFHKLTPEQQQEINAAMEHQERGQMQDEMPGSGGGGAQGMSLEDEKAGGFDGGFRGSYLAAKMAAAGYGHSPVCQACGNEVSQGEGACPWCHTPVDPSGGTGYGGAPVGPGGPPHAPQSGGAAVALPHGQYAKTADTFKEPQSEMTVAPEKVDTLRQEQVCPICGSMMEDGICEVCNFEEPPEGFGNPDLTKAQDTDDMQQEQGIEAEDAQQDSMQVQNAQEQGQMMPQQPGGQQAQPGGMPMAASYKDADTASVSSEHVAADLAGGRVNTKEKPLLPATRQTTDNPRQQRTVKDSVKPVESHNNEENMSDTTKTADNNAGEELANGKRVTLEGVGGVAGDENPEGHKTVSVDGVGGVVADDGSGEHVDLEQGLLEEVGDNTDTWQNGQGDSLGQHSPVSDKSVATLGSKRIEFLAADTVEGDLATAGGKVVDLEGSIKEEVGGPTDTFGGDSFHLTDPVTTDVYPTEGEVTGDGGVNNAGDPFPSVAEGVKTVGEHSEGGSDEKLGAVRAHFMAALKLAEAEIALGMTDEDAKYDRIAELENESPQSVKSRLDTVSRVKKAGLAKKVAVVARPKPSFQSTASTEPLRQVEAGVDDEAEGIFS